MPSERTDENQNTAAEGPRNEGDLSSYRRRFLQGVGATGAAGVLAGCLGGGDENGDEENGNEENGDDPEPASFEVSDVTLDESVTIGDAVEISATITNGGGEEGTRTVEVTVDGDAHDDTELTLEAGDEESVSFAAIETADLGADEHDYEISTGDDAASGTFTVEGVDAESLLSIASEISVIPGENVLEATLENTLPVAVESGEITAEFPDGWEVVDESGTTFDTLEPGSSQPVEVVLLVPDGDDDYELTVEESYTVADEDASFTTTVNVVRQTTYTVPETGGGVAEESAFTLLPEGDQLSNESGDPPTGPDDLSAEFSFGYDEENLYLLGEVSDDAHTAIAGDGMWEADSIQYAAGYDGTYGPEDGISHVDGETSTHRWMDGENEAGLDQVDATTSRDDEAGVTTYEATIPWETILPEAPEPGDSFRFGVIVNEDDDGEGREAVLNWTQPAINVDKTYGALGTFILDEPLSAPYGLNAGGHPEEPESEVPVVIDDLEFVAADDPAAIENVEVTYEMIEMVEDVSWWSPPAGVTPVDESIDGTDHDALYQTEFFSPDLGFDIEIENGTYDVIMHFSEVNFEAEGERVFDLSVQGETVAEGVDIFAEVGYGTAMTLTAEGVEVTDEVLSISSTSHEDLTKFCGVEIREVGTVVDPLEDLSYLADDSDTDFLGIDTQNVEMFERPDGSNDEARLNRAGGAGEASAVYRPGGELQEATVALHTHLAEGGEIEIEESADGGETWSSVSFGRAEYGTVTEDWANELVTVEFSDGVDSVRFTLIGETVWTPQIGHVEITYRE